MAQGNGAEGRRAAWWRRPITVWSAIIAAIIILLIGFVMMKRDQSPAMRYGAFLDQLEAGNVASVTVEGTQINGRLKHPVERASLPTQAQDQTTFTSRVPDFGDPALIDELRKQPGSHQQKDQTALITDHKDCALRSADIHQPQMPRARVAMSGPGNQSQIVKETGSAMVLVAT